MKKRNETVFTSFQDLAAALLLGILVYNNTKKEKQEKIKTEDIDCEIIEPKKLEYHG